jgi:aspartokinase-like uncharacterized kinase
VKAAGPVVVKLGGSLLGSPQLGDLLGCLTEAATHGIRIVIVPGGGPFADAVRRAQDDCAFDDAAAHDMALLAMAQYGCLLGALATPRLQLAWGAAELADQLAEPAGRALVWLPQPNRDALDVERSWRIGADALALWLAARLGAQGVILVKSCARPAGQSLASLADAGIIDTAYGELAAALPATTATLVYAANTAALEDALAAFKRP